MIVPFINKNKAQGLTPPLALILRSRGFQSLGQIAQHPRSRAVISTSSSIRTPPTPGQ